MRGELGAGPGHVPSSRSELVKWEGYPDTTPEPLWKILKQTNHPDILRDIKQCKEDFYLQHPNARAADLLDFAGVNLLETMDPVSVIACALTAIRIS